MAQVTIVRADADGEDPGYVAATAGGDFIVPAPGSRILLLIRNADASAHTVTIDDPSTSSPPGATAFDPDVAVAVPAGEDRVVALTPLARFVGTDGRVDIAYSAATGMSVAAIAVP